jgi:putative addiction module component (TIGR02574 family)
MTLEAVLKDAMSLTARERALLADELWRSVPRDEADMALTAAQRADLQRRVEEDDAGNSDPQDWEQARADLRRGE